MFQIKSCKSSSKLKPSTSLTPHTAYVAFSIFFFISTVERMHFTQNEIYSCLHFQTKSCSWISPSLQLQPSCSVPLTSRRSSAIFCRLLPTLCCAVLVRSRIFSVGISSGLMGIFGLCWFILIVCFFQIPEGVQY